MHSTHLSVSQDVYVLSPLLALLLCSSHLTPAPSSLSRNDHRHLVCKFKKPRVFSASTPVCTLLRLSDPFSTSDSFCCNKKSFPSLFNTIKPLRMRANKPASILSSNCRNGYQCSKINKKPKTNASVLSSRSQLNSYKFSSREVACRSAGNRNKKKKRGCVWQH